MSHVIEILADALTGEQPDVPTYVVSCDPEARNGRGSVWATTDLEQAKKFEDAAVAWEYWRQQSRTVLLRPDGKPNRPLTAYTCEIRQVD